VARRRRIVSIFLANAARLNAAAILESLSNSPNITATKASTRLGEV